MADTPTPDLSPAALEALADAISRPQPLCPYDPRSPDSRDPERSPDDKPCPRCGSTEDGPDMCFGADPTNFVRAAATLRALSAEVIRLREALLTVTASLVASTDLLQRAGKAVERAAPSAKMFQLMLSDYEKAVEIGRAALEDET